MSWVKALLGCGCICAVVGFFVVGIGGYFAYKAASSTFMLDPKKVEQLAERESPGARPPLGYQPKFAMDMKALRMAVYQDSSGGHSLMLMAIPLPAGSENEKLDHDQLIQQLEAGLSNNSKEKRGEKKVLEQKEIAVEIQGQKLSGVRRKTEEDGKRQWEYYVVGKKPKDQDLLCVVGFAPESDVSDGFVRDYAKSVKMMPLEVEKK